MTGKELATLDQAVQELEKVRNESIACLGDGEVFVRKTPEGQIRSIKAPVRLSEATGEIAVIKGKAMTTGKGYYKANQITSLSIITPQKLKLPTGETVVNPYPVIDAESGTVRKFWVKKQAVGHGPLGNLVVTSVTLLYDLNMYFIQDLLKKVKYNSACGRIAFEAQLTEEEKKTGIFYKIDGSLGVWANVSHKDILTCIDTFVNKKQFAERNAQTICERLAMSKHPALSHIAAPPVHGEEEQRVAQVTVVGYVNDYTREQLEELTAKAERDEDVIEINGETAQVIEETTEASYEDVAVHDDDEKVIQDGEIVEEEAPGLFQGGKY